MGISVYSVKSPVMGIFYCTPEEGANPFVKEGDRVDGGDVVCVIESMKIFNGTLQSWSGTRKNNINGITTIITEYSRKALKGSGDFRIRLIRVLAGSKSFTLTVSYNKEESFTLEPITSRIISSLKLSGFKPQLDGCVHCQKEITFIGAFSTRLGGILCKDCVSFDKNAKVALRGSLASIGYIEKSDFSEALKLQMSRNIAAELAIILGSFLDVHLDKQIKSRNFLH